MENARPGRSSPKLIADGDSAARNAFRVGLRGGSSSAGTTQELDPSDILEVQDLAEAIARAEVMLASPPPPRSSRPDLFESLGRRATDDTAGPATPAPAYAAISSARTAPSAQEEDAFYHPVGRMRSLADVTLDGYRPEPTLLVRAASRRKRFGWVMLAGLLPLVVLAAIAVFASGSPALPASPASSASSASSAAARTPPAGPPVFDVNSLPPAPVRP